MNTNHYGLKIFCAFCHTVFRTNVLSFEQILVDILNVTTFGAFHFRQRHEMSFAGLFLNLKYPPHLIRRYILTLVSPRIIISPSYGVSVHFQMHTVYDKSHLMQPSWSTFFQPFQSLVWISLLCLAFGYWLLCRTISTELRNCQGSLSLSLYASLTDNFAQVKKHFVVKFLLAVWSVHALYFTILFGGEVVTSVSLTTSPEFPKTLSELAGTKSTKLSIASYRIMSSKSGYNETSDISLLINDFFDDDLRRSSKSSERIAASGKLTSLATELSTNFCSSSQIQLNTLNQEKPFSCRDRSMTMNYETGHTFLSYMYDTQAIRHTYRSFSKYWVSPVSDVKEFADTLTVILHNNYMAKLVLPLVSYLMASGLVGPMLNEERQSFQTKWFLPGTAPLTYVENSLKFASHFKFSPMALSAISALAGLFGFLYIVSIVCILLELFVRNNLSVKKISLHNLYAKRSTFTKTSANNQFPIL